MVAHIQGTTPIDVPSSYISSYTIGPIDPTHLLTLTARLSDGQDIPLLVPAHLPLSLLSDLQFKDGYEWGRFRADIEEGWTIPHMVNHIYHTLRAELCGECTLSTSAWAVGFLLGNLIGLAKTERTLALVGIAHLRFLLACISLDIWLSDRFHRLIQQMDSLHITAIRAYRARVRLSRAQGISFSEAQFLALAGGTQPR